MSMQNGDLVTGRMKAVFLEGPEGPLAVRETDIPRPATGEVLVKIAASPINPSDISAIRNAHKNHDLNTFIPGIEGSGRVVAAGRGFLPSFLKGKRVACSSTLPTSGAWAEYMVTSAAKCFPLSKKISDEQGSMSLVNPLTALAFIDIVKRGKHKALINNAAASSLGRMVLLLSGKEGIPLINIVRRAEQAEILKRLGAENIINSSDPGFTDDLRSLASRLNATILFDSVGGPRFPEIIEALPSGSSVVIYGVLSKEDHVVINPRRLLANDIKISGFYLGNHTRKNAFIKNILDLRRVSRLMSSEMVISVNAVFPLEKAQEAFDTYLKNMSAGKVLLQT
jgi:NADPH:quinone reductase